ncbi:haloacid dehalogenase, type II [Vibrio sp. UCD-FRSSP16_10]|uniref:haloacid dehalogenase type II n=1 Tax=unclassified Vibrio TaxID=2614977 RepID=UPI000800DD2B|nr:MULTISPECIES: haloacid dehalogenase type II [unclassified Vibrio]OBT13932.1 haloacid dehalogenase, type II [Vibrio sp. UCD-FRSSP16_30]OBT22813.1 haloacid dehalogenase, type II [Vibrio sp. UCD-FRSSP16_10]
MPTQVILFDINETVLDLSVLKPKFLHYFADEHYMNTWFAMLLHSSTVCLVTEVKTDFKSLALASLHSLASRLGKPLSDEGCSDILSTMANLPAHHDIKPALTALKQAGFKLVAFSNSSTALLQSQLSNADLIEYFDDVISVESAATFKPSAKAYQYAVDTLALPPSEICLVATHDWDTHGALSCGLKAAFIERLSAFYNPHYQTPDIIGTDMEEIAQQIITKWKHH